jgi:hypothetical protein
MKILRPVPASKRQPVIKQGDFTSDWFWVRFKMDDGSWLRMLAYCDIEGNWSDDCTNYFSDTAIEWYEEIEIESLFPDEDKSYKAAQSAADGLFHKTIMHQEGQTYFKNYLLKELEK